MADDNRPVQYMRYAAGEIALVVIGILIALQINNWNEERKERKEEQKLLRNLHIEFKTNYDNLKERDSVLEITIQSIEFVFEQMAKPTEVQQHKNVDSLLSKMLSSPTWSPSEYVLNDLKNSGNLTKLSSQNLKSLLFEWSRFFSLLSENQQQVETTSKELIAFIKENGSLRNVDAGDLNFNYSKSILFSNNETLLSNYKFENYLDDKLYVLKISRRDYSNAEKLILKILDETTLK